PDSHTRLVIFSPAGQPIRAYTGRVSVRARGEARHACAEAHFLRAAALPPLASAFFCAVVPPCFALEPDPDFFSPRLEAPGLLAIRAARDFDMPFSFSFSYCFSFLTLADLDGISAPLPGWPYSFRGLSCPAKCTAVTTCGTSA